MLTRIDVTQHDINTGGRHSCGYCPVALGFRRATGLACNVGTGTVHSWKGPNSEWRHHQLPPTVVEWIECFDRGEPMAPFSFELEV